MKTARPKPGGFRWAVWSALADIEVYPTDEKTHQERQHQIHSEDAETFELESDLLERFHFSRDLVIGELEQEGEHGKMPPSPEPKPSKSLLGKKRENKSPESTQSLENQRQLEQNSD